MRSRVVATVLITLAVLCACSAEPEGPPSGAVEIARPPRPSQTKPGAAAPSPFVAGDLGGWTPETRWLDLAHQRADLGPDDDEPPDWQDLSPEDRIKALRAGLRLTDGAAATACAAELGWWHLDGWESARAVDLLATEVFRPGTRADASSVWYILASKDLERLLRSRPPRPWGISGGQLGDLHRLARAEHVPLFCELARSPDRGIATWAWEMLDIVSQHTSKHREAIGALDLRLDVDALPDREHEDGLHPFIQRYLTSNFHLDGSEFTGWSPVHHWWYGWWRESVPAAHDAEFLIELHRTIDGAAGLGRAPALALLQLGQLDDPLSEGYLLELASEDDAALFALARRRNPWATERLLENAASTPAALSVLLEAAPARIVPLFVDRLLAADEDVAEDAFLTLRQARDHRERFGLRWTDDALVEGIRARWEGAGNVRTAELAGAFPGLRTRACARDFVRRFDEDVVRWVVDNPSEPGPTELVALLEVAAPGAFRTQLRRLAMHESDDVRDAARSILFRWGDPDSASMILDWWDTTGRLDRHFKWLWVRLARSAGPAVAAYLADRSQDENTSTSDQKKALASLAACYGVPERIAEQLEDTPLPEAAEQAIFDGRGVDGVIELLRSRPDEKLPYVSLIRDPRVTSYLRRLREQRHLGLYWWATGELAVQGDRGAEAEFKAALKDGRNGVVSNAWAYHTTFGFDLARIPFCIAELESNCCRAPSGTIQSLFGDAVEDPRTGATDHDRALGYWNAAGGRFVWSRLADRFVPEPR